MLYHKSILNKAKILEIKSVCLSVTIRGRAGNFPEYFHFPGTGIPETFRVFPGNFPGT